VSQEILELSQKEHDWIAGNEEFARRLFKDLGLKSDGLQSIDPRMLDAAWAAWLGRHIRGREDPNPFINAFGITFGQYLAERLDLSWKIGTDEDGTELALHGQPGDILVFPPSLVGKRYVAGVTQFFAEVFAEMEQSIGLTRRGRLPDGAQSADPARGWYRRVSRRRVH